MMAVHSVRAIQARLSARGIHPGPIDNQDGPRTRAAMDKFRAKFGISIQDDFHPSGLHTIVMHWSAGWDAVSDDDRDHYHRITDRAGVVHAGKFSPLDNVPPLRRGAYAPHTWQMNGGAIGVCMDGMVDAVERPFDPGPEPITRVQLGSFVRDTAAVAREYRIPVSRFTLLTHAEVEPTLGVKQRQKWDITWLPGMRGPGDPVRVGGIIRDMIAAVPE
jgi:hypothetical protein